LKAEREQLQQSIKDAEAAIRELGEGLLPFTLAAGLCQAFHEQLRAEGALQRWLAHESLIEGRVNALKADVESTLFPAKDSSKLPKGARGKMIQRVKGLMDQLLEKPPDMPVVELIHRVSEEDRSRLLGAIERVFRELPRQLSTQQRRLERNIRRLRDVEKSLEKIPTDEVLKPVLDEIRDLHRELGTTQIDVERGELLVKEIDLLIIDLDRRERKVQDRLREAEKIHGRIALAAKVQAVLEDYAASLTSAKTTDLRDGIARCFTQLWRKGDLVRRIDIDPADFTVSLFDAQDRVMPKKELSAGEKQIYAISLLWALAQASGRPLPIVIDTPLGRLDSEHRSQLVRRYFPQASHQVVIFSTDTEIDRAYFRELGPAISHAYQLRFDPSEARCVLEEGYFWGADEREVGHAG
jgi:DNA sulfur modification protein DndD